MRIFDPNIFDPKIFSTGALSSVGSMELALSIRNLSVAISEVSAHLSLTCKGCLDMVISMNEPTMVLVIEEVDMKLTGGD